MALSLLFLFDLGEPVPTYKWNLKLRSSSLVVTENHRAFTVRAGFQLQHHRHISLGIKAFWGSFGRPLVSGLSRLPLPHTSALQTQQAGNWVSATHPPAWEGSTEQGPCEFDEIREKKVTSVQMHCVHTATKISGSPRKEGKVLQYSQAP